MDLAHEFSHVDKSICFNLVSILVLVDLAHEYWHQPCEVRVLPSFNPCFSGSCSRMGFQVMIESRKKGFNPCFSGSCSRIGKLMGYAIVFVSFNPCFSGSCSRIKKLAKKRLVVLVCFNPCFSGSCSRIGQIFPLFD